MRVAYVPYTRGCLGPGDRRRFCFYANSRSIDYEVYVKNRTYDVVVLSSLSDLPYWSRLPRRGGPLLVYDIVDSYLEIPPDSLRARLRGPAKYLLGQHSHLELSYHESVRKMVARADAISCATPEQQTTLGMFNDNVHPILDIQDGDLGAKKDNYEVGPTINLVWDGLATNLDAFAHVVDVLRKINDTTSLAVHVVTNIEYKPVNGPVPALPTTRLLSKYLDGVKTYLYQWNSHTVAQLCAACDIAIIPMKRGSPVHMAKPENKLLYYWRVGLPTIVERTSAYDRTMTGANLDYCCSSGDEWERKLTRLIASQTERKAVAQEGREYAERVQGTEILLSKWDALFTSILS